MPVTIVVGGQFGSEGKGKVASIVAREQNATAVVRVGGSNSGHTPDRLGDSPQTSGLWLADCLDYVGDDPDLDDVVFHMVRDSNHDKRVAKKFPQFQPRRFIA